MEQRTAEPQEWGSPADSDDFETFWRRHSPELYRCCLSWTATDSGDAEEALSRLAIGILLKLPTHRHEIVNLRAWCRTLARNICMDLHREKRRRGEESLNRELESEEPTGLPIVAQRERDPEHHVLGKELEGFLRQSIRDLPEPLRNPLEMRLRNESYARIAGALRISEANARKRVQLARENLRRCLRRYREGNRLAAVEPRNGKHLHGPESTDV